MTVVMSAEKLTKTFGSHRGIVGVDFKLRRERSSASWPERGGQVNNDPSPDWALPPDIGRRKGLRTQPHRRRCRDPSTRRIPSRGTLAAPALDRSAARRLRCQGPRYCRTEPSSMNWWTGSRSTSSGPLVPSPRAIGRRSASCSPSCIDLSWSSSTSPHRDSTL